MNLSLPTWFRKFRLAFAAGAVVLVCILFFAFRFSQVSELEKAQIELEDEVRKMQRNIGNGENLESQLARIEKITGRLSERTVNPEDASVNKAYFYQFEKPRLEIQSVEQRNLDTGDGEEPWRMKNFGTVEFTVSATGSFTDVLELAYEIRGGPKLVRITALSMLPEGAGRERTVELTVEAVAEKLEDEEESNGS